jgi:phage recombination protein Bet
LKLGKEIPSREEKEKKMTDTQLPTEWNAGRLELLKRTICKDSTNDEFELFIEVAKRSGLNPFARQIHAVKRAGKMVIQTGIDGYRLIADRTGKYAGSDDPIFDDEKKPNKATVTVYKLVEGTRCAFTASARWEEYHPGDSQGFAWKKMPCVMLGKCAESLALRKAFPAELSGLYTNEEMEQAGSGVFPEQPTPEDGFPKAGAGEYIIPFGKFAKRGLDEIALEDLRKYVVYIENKAEKDGKPLQGQALDFIERATAHIAAFENGDAPDFGNEPGAEG